MVFEVTSPQAFEGLHIAGRTGIDAAADPLSRMQIKQLDINCQEFGITQFGITQFGITRPQQGSIPVIGPEQGATLPGMTVVAGDAHTSTHGAFAALALRCRHFGCRACAGNADAGDAADDIAPERKHRLLNGLDPIGLRFEKSGSLRAHEARRREQEPWLFG